MYKVEDKLLKESFELLLNYELSLTDIHKSMNKKASTKIFPIVKIEIKKLKSVIKQLKEYQV